ncbi:hypothetical protein [Hydrogenivirga sp. 128-5-R1-1]|uniref:hypothetical protein n=1 Tax=Hydrogenivirga sp. 128-5-R1-1 TaxID=392423 RepID=UPI00015F177F|nr:hypothetical protein [Hydrogenivirga sp. 128-5-R1-1]EDP76232.1 probable transmembrane protein [Hydrogenivirga sp. 128-5-R1-1]
MNIKGVSVSSVIELSGLALLYSFKSLESVLAYLALHVSASVIVAASLRPLLPRRLRRGSFWAFSLLTSLSGPVGFLLMVAIYMALTFRRVEAMPLYENVSTEIMPEVEFSGRKIGEASLKANNPRIVLYMSKTPHPLAVRYLKEAVSSEEDEVRLVAFATLSFLEKEIMDKIGSLKESLKSIYREEELFSTYLSLAELYWELVYLNISDKELEEFYLDEVSRYGEEALSIKDSPKAHFLLGRLYLRRRNIELAEKHLTRAVELGFPEERVVTYLLEILYVKRDYKRLFELSSKFSHVLPTDPRAASIMRVWI